MDLSDSGAIFTTAGVVLGVILYIYTAICFYRIAKNLRVKPAWFAWVPLLDIYLWCKICGKGILWTILFFIPIVDIVIYIMLCLKLAHACGRSRVFGVIFIFPILNLPVLWLFARGSKSLTVTRIGEVR